MICSAIKGLGSGALLFLFMACSSEETAPSNTGAGGGTAGSTAVGDGGAANGGGGSGVSGSGGSTGGSDAIMDATAGTGGSGGNGSGGSGSGDAGPPPATAYVYVSRNGSQITIFTLDMATGKLSAKGSATSGGSTPYLAFSPGNQFLYAVGDGSGSTSRVYAYKINKADGSLTAINSAPTGGDGAPHLAVHPNGKIVMVAHYNSGHVSTLMVDASGGVTMPPADVQQPADKTSHQIVTDPSGKFVLVPNVDSNTIFQFTIDATTGKLTANGQVAGFPANAGPRHMALHPSGRSAYTINEVATTVSSLLYDSATGKLSGPQTIDSLPAGAVRDMYTSGAHIVAHPSGKFVFASNRGHNSISTFAVDANGRLTLSANETGGGMINMPRDFGMDPSGKFLVVGNQDADNVMVFEIGQTDGKLTLKDTKPVPSRPSFVGVVFL